MRVLAERDLRTRLAEEPPNPLRTSSAFANARSTSRRRAGGVLERLELTFARDVGPGLVRVAGPEQAVGNAKRGVVGGQDVRRPPQLVELDHSSLRTDQRSGKAGLLRVVWRYAAPGNAGARLAPDRSLDHLDVPVAPLLEVPLSKSTIRSHTIAASPSSWYAARMAERTPADSSTGRVVALEPVGGDVIPSSGQVGEERVVQRGALECSLDTAVVVAALLVPAEHGAVAPPENRLELSELRRLEAARPIRAGPEAEELRGLERLDDVELRTTSLRIVRIRLRVPSACGPRASSSRAWRCASSWSSSLN